MDQSSRNSESSPFKLPEVQLESKDTTPQFEAGRSSADESSMSKAIERNSMNSTLGGVNTQSTMPLTVDPSIIDDQSSTIQTNASPKKINITDNLPANDVDLIEKAWVVKAKAIVEQTRNDPHEQSNEINKIREDYQSKRFNTKLKIDKD